MGEVLRALDREAAVHVDRALRPTGRARRVDEHVRCLGVGGFVVARRRAARGFPWCRLVPPSVAALDPRSRDRLAGPPNDDHPSNRGGGFYRFIRHGFQRHPGAATQEGVGGDEGRRVAVGEAGGDRRRRVAGEDRRIDGAKPPKGQHGHDRLHEHRQQDADPVTGANPERVKAPRGPLDGLLQLAVGQCSNSPVLGLPDEGPAVGISCGAGVDRRSRVVQLPAGPPACPGRAAARVKHRARPPAPGDAEVLGRRAPEPARVGHRPSLQRVE